METRLAMVRRHARRGGRLPARQREIVAELARDGHRTADALRLLDIF